MMRFFTYYDRSALTLTLLLGLAGLGYLWSPTDPDVWWHVRSGQLVIESGVPLTDPMSFTTPGARWVLHEWLTEVGMYLIQHYLGYIALVGVFAVLTVAAYALLYRVLRRVGAGPAFAIGLVGIRMIMDAPTWGVRPQVLVTLFFTIFLAVALRYRDRTTAPPGAAPVTSRGLAAWIGPDREIWLLPPLMLLWANMHSGFLVGILLLGIWVVGEAANNLLGGRPPVPLRPLVAVTLACAVVWLINPNGIDLLLLPLTYLGGPQAGNLLPFIQEWQPPDPRRLTAAPFVLTLVSLLLLAMVRPRTPPPPPQRPPAPQRCRGPAASRSSAMPPCCSRWEASC